MKFFLLMACCLLTMAACKQKSRPTTHNVKPSGSHQVFIDTVGNHWNRFEKIPYHLRTEEQKLFIASLNYVLLNGVVAEHNHMVLKLSKKECLAKGMPEETYEELQSNLKVNNRYFDSLGVSKAVPKMIDDLHRDLIAYKARGYRNINDPL